MSAIVKQLKYIREHPIRSVLLREIGYTPKEKNLFLFYTLLLTHHYEMAAAFESRYKLMIDQKNPSDEEAHFLFVQMAWSSFYEQATVTADYIRRFKKYLNRYCIQHHLSCRIKRSQTESAYYIFKETISVEEERLSERRRHVRKRLKIGSIFIGVLYAFGMASFAVTAPWSLIIVVCISIIAFSVYFSSGRSALYHSLKQIFFNRIYEDADRRTMNPKKKQWIRASLLFSLLAGTLQGCLYFHTTLSMLMHLFLGASLTTLACAPVGLIVIATIIGIGTTIACATLFYFAFSELIKSNVERKLINYFKKNFYDIFKHTHWQILLFREKAKHVLKSTGLFLLHSVELILRVGLLGAILFLNYHFYQVGIGDVLRSLDVSVRVTQIATQVLSAMAICVETPFSLNNIQIVHRLVCYAGKESMRGLKNLYTCVNPSQVSWTQWMRSFYFVKQLLLCTRLLIVACAEGCTAIDNEIGVTTDILLRGLGKKIMPFLKGFFLCTEMLDSLGGNLSGTQEPCTHLCTPLKKMNRTAWLKNTPMLAGKRRYSM
jgi:hypothetical protein